MVLVVVLVLLMMVMLLVMLVLVLLMPLNSYLFHHKIKRPGLRYAVLNSIKAL